MLLCFLRIRFIIRNISALYIFIIIYFETISRPKGVNARESNLKCCLAHGMPIIVIPSKKPKNKCVNTIQIPPIINQIRFIIVDKQPGAEGL